MYGNYFLTAIVPERESVLQCHCLHGKCAYRVDENFAQRVTGCVCLPGKSNKKYFKYIKIFLLKVIRVQIVIDVV